MLLMTSIWDSLCGIAEIMGVGKFIITAILFIVYAIWLCSALYEFITKKIGDD